jgi:hypothetical protein
LLAVAFFWTASRRPGTQRRRSANDAFPDDREEDRDASTSELATEVGDRGRQAGSPAEIPSRGWKDILWRVYGNVSDHRILALAAGMTYCGLLAIFPAWPRSLPSTDCSPIPAASRSTLTKRWIPSRRGGRRRARATHPRRDEG